MEQTYEVRVRRDGKMSMFHIFASDHKSRRLKQKFGGQIISIRKVDSTKIFGNIEKLNLGQQPLPEKAYHPALAIDEMIWMKRNRRRDNMAKDKPI